MPRLVIRNLTPELIAEGAQLFHSGSSFKMIGEKLGVSAVTALRYYGGNASRLLEFIECIRCHKTKPREDFRITKRKTRICRECVRIKYSSKSLEWLYGISLSIYQKILRSQNGACAICHTTDPCGETRIKRFSVDHDHDTGEIRGLLCNNCNRFIGLAGESIEVLESAIAYLKQHCEDQPADAVKDCEETA